MSDEDEVVPSGGARKRSSPYPRDSLQEAEQVLRHVFRLGPRHVRQDVLAQELDFSGVNNGAYRRLRASANYFGLIEFTGDDYISVPEAWIRVLHDEDPDEEAAARVRAVKQPTLYQQLFGEYEGRMLPPLDRLARELHVKPEYGILKDAAPAAAQVFYDSVQYAGLVDDRGFLRSEAPTITDASEPEIDGHSPSVEAQSPTPREAPPVEGDVDRLEVRLRDGRKVYVLIPSPGTLTAEDKQRIKGHIDLVIEEED